MFVRALLVLAVLALAPSAAAQSFNAQEQAEIRALVRDYLVRNPDVLDEALQALETRTSAERRLKIEGDRRDFVMGPADAQVTVVEFFDYRCPYCHAALEWVTELSRTRRDIRIVLKELPVLGPESLEAARAALAAKPQGRYWQFHQALMGFRGDLTSERINAIARQSGIDVARMRARMDDPEITAHLEQTQGLAVDSGITGTPGFLINGELISGFNRDALAARIREATREATARRASR